MCHYETLVFPSIVAFERLNALFGRFSLAPSQIANPDVALYLHPGEVHCVARQGMCHCGTALGSGRYRPPRPSLDDADVIRLRRKGWSEARIGRWFQEKNQAADRKDRARAERLQMYYSPSAQRWRDFLVAAWGEAGIEGIGLLLHWYRRGLDDEPFEALRRERVALASLTAELLLQIEEDVIYEFRG